MKFLSLLIALSLLLAGSVMAKECSVADADSAELAVDNLSNWHSINENFKRYGHCDEGSIAEGNSEAVVRLFVDKWNTLPTLYELTSKDPALEDWVLSHIDSTLGTDDLQKVTNLATSQCPESLSALCKRISEAAKRASREN